MSTPEIPNAEVPPAPSKNRKAILAWMIVAQVLSVVFILFFIGLEAFISLIGGGMLAGGGWNFLDILMFLTPLFLIPIVVSWVVYRKGKVRTALVMTTVTFFVLVCPGVVVFLAIAFSS